MTDDERNERHCLFEMVMPTVGGSQARTLRAIATPVASTRGWA